MSTIAVLGTCANETNVELVDAWRARGVDCELVTPDQALRASAYETVLGRLDVLPSLDGVERGLLELLWLERRGVPTLNTARALLATHDKLRTAVALERARVPHPRTTHLRVADSAALQAPVVLKPRFGSWGRDVCLCRTERDVTRSLADFSARPWFRRQGVLAQEAVPSPGFDLRLVVAGARAIGAVERHAAPGEWRTNVSVGGTKRAVTPPRAACELAIAAARAVGADLVGVDLLPTPDGYVVIEVNGAVEFDPGYKADGDDIYTDLAVALGIRSTCRPKALRTSFAPGALIP